MATHFTLSSCAFVLFLVVVHCHPVRACEPAPGSAPFLTDPEAWPDDVTPPGAITQVSVEAHASYDDGGCDDCGAWPAKFRLHVTPPTDDQAPADALGYRVSLVEGRIPRLHPTLEADLHDPYTYGDDAVLTFVWDDADGSRGLDAVLRVQAIDPAGNVGPPIDVPVVMRSADSGEGCSATRRRGGGAPLLLAGAVLFGATRLRRRRRRAMSPR